MVTIVAHPLLFTHSATCAAEQTTPNVTRGLSGPVLTDPVVVGVNETISIWCSASTTIMFMGRKTLRGLFWRYSNGTRVPVVEMGGSIELDVYAEPYAGMLSNSTETWRRALHFNRVQPSSAENYSCVADYMYNQTLKSQSVRVTGM